MMMVQWAVKKVKTRADVLMVMAIDAGLFAEDEQLDAEDMEESQWWLLYDKSTGDVAGYCGAAVLTDGEDPNWKILMLCKTGVRQVWQGKGGQKYMIKARERWGRRHGAPDVITYTSPWSVSSANSLISCGYKLYLPQNRYGLEDGLYFQKKLKGKVQDV